MPELPEVETVRRDLASLVVGRVIEQVEATAPRCIRRHPSAEDFCGRLAGGRIEEVDRRGKYLLVRLDGGVVLVVHLGMSGQLLWVQAEAIADEPRRKHTHVVLTLDAGEVHYVDPRTFGELFVTTDDVPELAHLGPSPVDPDLTPARLRTLLRARRTQLKPLLMDQRFLAGIGNLYADEILWLAKLRYDRPAASLTPAEVRRLHAAMVETLTAAIERRGSSLADEQYRDLFGAVGDYQADHTAYDREGKPCPRCGRPIARIKWSGRSTFLCPRCQR